MASGARWVPSCGQPTNPTKTPPMSKRRQPTTSAQATKPAPLRTLAELGQHTHQIVCDRCKQTQPSAGATRWHALHICAACTAQLQALKDNT